MITSTALGRMLGYVLIALIVINLSKIFKFLGKGYIKKGTAKHIVKYLIKEILILLGIMAGVSIIITKSVQDAVIILLFGIVFYAILVGIFYIFIKTKEK